MKVAELMSRTVIVAHTTDTVADVRRRMTNHDVHALPVLDDAHRPAGIVTSSDLVRDHDAALPVSHIMTTRIYTVGRDEDSSLAARTMRNHRLHHLVVTDGRELVGIVSAFDLLQLVEEQSY